MIQLQKITIVTANNSESNKPRQYSKGALHFLEYSTF